METNLIGIDLLKARQENENLKSENLTLTEYKIFYFKLKKMIDSSMEIHGENDKVSMGDLSRLIQNINPKLEKIKN